MALAGVLLAASARALPAEDGATLSLQARSFADTQHVEGITDRYALTQSLQLKFASRATIGPIAFGLELAPFAATVLSASPGAGDLVWTRNGTVGAENKTSLYVGRLRQSEVRQRHPSLIERQRVHHRRGWRS